MTASSPDPAGLAGLIAERVSARSQRRRPGAAICLEIRDGDGAARVGIAPDGAARVLGDTEEFAARITLHASAGTAAEVLAGNLSIPDAITEGLIRVSGEVAQLASVGEQLRSVGT